MSLVSQLLVGGERRLKRLGVAAFRASVAAAI